jgi:hypothetical protein
MKDVLKNKKVERMKDEEMKDVFVIARSGRGLTQCPRKRAKRVSYTLLLRMGATTNHVSGGDFHVFAITKR